MDLKELELCFTQICFLSSRKRRTQSQLLPRLPRMIEEFEAKVEDINDGQRQGKYQASYLRIIGNTPRKWREKKILSQITPHSTLEILKMISYLFLILNMH